jgi:hypothetical protein
MNWNDFFGGLASLAPVGIGIAAAVEGPAQPITLASGQTYFPQTGQVIGNTGLLGSGSSSSLILILLIGLALIFALRK